MQTVPNPSPDQGGAVRDAAWWAGYAAALRDFPDGIGDVVEANRLVVAELLARIEAGPWPHPRPALRLVSGSAA